MRALAEYASVGLLSDERDCSRPQIRRDAREPLGGACEVAATEVARTGRRAVGGVRDAEAEARKLVLLARVEQAGGEPGVMQEAPEVVARVREVRADCGREASGVDAAEDDVEARSEYVGQCSRGRRGRGTSGALP